MTEINDYDKAAHKFYNTQKITGPSILSWDIFSTYFDKLCKNYADIHSLNVLSKTNNWSYSSVFEEELLQKESVIIVTDPYLSIVHASNNVHGMNGYKPEEILGKKPKMFQGEGTNRETTAYISEAVKNKVPFEATILNYRKNGEPYKCWIKGGPVFDKRGKVVNFIAFEKEVA
ncbi:PAS domain-containing protein [Spongiimicrobium sp. 3-5]|uniref:PAS domain-containing protein n=1 Tax=Spongiimicrobium sp. 3-5 TaxID=3332596 RepID=UPI00397EA27E